MERRPSKGGTRRRSTTGIWRDVLPCSSNHAFSLCLRPSTFGVPLTIFGAGFCVGRGGGDLERCIIASTAVRDVSPFIALLTWIVRVLLSCDYSCRGGDARTQRRATCFESPSLTCVGASVSLPCGMGGITAASCIVSIMLRDKTYSWLRCYEATWFFSRSRRTREAR